MHNPTLSFEPGSAIQLMKAEKIVRGGVLPDYCVGADRIARRLAKKDSKRKNKFVHPLSKAAQ